MNADLLLLVPRSYPFGSQVDFLEEEIEHLAARFGAVKIAPLEPAGARQAVPANVTVDLDLAARVSSRRRRVQAGLSTSLGRRLMARELKAGGPPRRHPEALARLAAAAGVASQTAAWVEGMGSLPPATVGLTVWLGGATIGLASAGVTTVSRAHRGDLFAATAPHGYLPLQRRQLSAAHRVMSVSEAGRLALQERHPDVAQRCETRRLGVTGAAGLAAASADGVVRVVSCSSLTPVKRPLLLVEVIHELARKVASAEWHHFGSGPLRREFEEARAGLAGSVRVVDHGHVDNAAVLFHYASQPVDVFVNVSSSEGVPVSMMEAISAGVPVVGTDVGGVGEIVDRSTGELVPADAEPATVAEAVLRQAADGSARRRAGVRAAWCQRYSARRNYPDFARELAALAEEART